MTPGTEVIYFKGLPRRCIRTPAVYLGPCEKVKNKFDQRIRIQLPDGSRVSVNRDSVEKKPCPAS